MRWFTASFLLDWLRVVVVLPELRFVYVCWLFIVLRLEGLFAGGC